MPSSLIRVRCAPSRAEQALRLLDDPVEDDLGLAQGGDPGGDVAQRPLRVGPPGDGRLRALELLDEPGVGDGDGRLVGEAAEDRGVDVVEGVPLAPVDLDRPERALVADDRRDDEVADAGRPGQLVGRVEVLELAGEVVAGRDDPTARPSPGRTGPRRSAAACALDRCRAARRSARRRRPGRGRRLAGSYSSMTAPSARSRRRASSTMRWSRSPGSRMAVIRAAISRSARSASARRSMTARERASSSIRRALRMAIEACVASAVSTSPSASS